MTRIDDDVFSDLIHDGAPGFALLVDSGGPVIAAAGVADAAEIAAAALDVSKDAVRAAQHLGGGIWSAVVCESEGGVLGFALVGNDSTAIVGAPSPATAGGVRRLLGKVVARGGAITARV